MHLNTKSLLFVGIFSLYFINFVIGQTSMQSKTYFTPQEQQALIQTFLNPRLNLPKTHPVKFRFSYNPIKFSYRALLHAYQHGFTHQLRSGCMYSPSCSEFTRKAIESQGIAKGVLLGIDRLSRCTKVNIYQNPELYPIANLRFIDLPEDYTIKKNKH
jgi:putative component of membrane protein insertase Oxa1/YidC/SpoIIIJ protein YidD